MCIFFDNILKTSLFNNIKKSCTLSIYILVSNCHKHRFVCVLTNYWQVAKTWANTVSKYTDYKLNPTQIYSWKG